MRFDRVSYFMHIGHDQRSNLYKIELKIQGAAVKIQKYIWQSKFFYGNMIMETFLIPSKFDWITLQFPAFQSVLLLFHAGIARVLKC